MNPAERSRMRLKLRLALRLNWRKLDAAGPGVPAVPPAAVANVPPVRASLPYAAPQTASAALDQQLIFRPIPGLGRASTPIRGLYLASSSAHPGGSVHGACGNERGTSCIGMCATYTAPCRLRAAFGQVGEPAQRLAVAYVDAGHPYRLRNA